jgi:hypothetical protein
MFTIFWAVVLRRRDIEFPFWKAATRRARTVGPRRIKTALYRIRENPVSPVFWVAPAGLSIYHESHESLADAAQEEKGSIPKVLKEKGSIPKVLGRWVVCGRD